MELGAFLDRYDPLDPAEFYIPILIDKYKSMLERVLAVPEDFRGKKFDESINVLSDRMKKYQNI